ncbi:LysR family transcriptional regulator [Ilumatobacter sp.]|uniref:LysR family transcriptional regulator n=1 Tax=Ilumatobacter sp. TaxID=1967498 RepID=UPI003AF5D60C
MAELQLDVESLRTYLTVLDTGGMTRAAERLNLTQSAVSWKIKRLEERVGRPLLIRDGHAVRPTRDGRALLDDARTIVELHDGAVWRLRSPELTGKITLGSNEEIDANDIAALLGRFKRSHPNATIEFVIDHTERLATLVDNGQIDVALMQVTDRHLRHDDTLLWTDDLHWVTSAEWTYDEGTVPLVTFGDLCFYRRLSEPILEAAHIDFTHAFSGSATRGVLAAIQAGLGVGVLSSWYLNDDIIDWPRGATLPPLPRVHQVARTVPGESAEAAHALVDVIAEQLVEPSVLSFQ